ncbi:hypothetical protein RBU60_10805 [Mesonia sp. MT50]|uniref:Uncharacterized protein n=1 Tax=Mesonia profundi TaxID=3070998 RepID=A0ABU1A2Y2_9FLAO|nr:hypothetical protein [Mesonia profundi]MDQ7918067.1 hypothetical protein [Mesonia profundi]
MNHPNAAEVYQEIKNAWKATKAPPDSEMQYFTKGFGGGDASVFLNVRPMDIDQENERFLIGDALGEMSPVAASAYLGPYLLAFLEDLKFQEDQGFFSEPMLRGSVISFLSLPRTWSVYLKPNLTKDSKTALLLTVDYILQKKDLLKLNPQKIGAFERLGREIKRDAF